MNTIGTPNRSSYLVLIRFAFLVVFSCLAFFLRPFQLLPVPAAAAGFAVALALVFVEARVRAVSLKQLLGASIGGLVATLLAYWGCLVLTQALPQGGATVSFLQIGLWLLLTYIGLTVGAAKGDMLNLAAFGGVFGGEQTGQQSFKILDTSVIIDGRIADIAETGFLEGVLVIPQFVLRELQLVADSSDSMKRNRGRRGLDVLQRIQKLSQVTVRIVEDDFPHLRDVDDKLLELAQVYRCKVVTNDFNLNKVAQVRGVSVLNINDLANAMRPVVLPGETMRVFILKEGKEYNQGVAYLDDGTMVVIDNARKMISKTVDVTVTSVLQTTAGKMIFGKLDERAQAYPPRPVAVDGNDRSATNA